MITSLIILLTLALTQGSSATTSTNKHEVYTVDYFDSEGQLQETVFTHEVTVDKRGVYHCVEMETNEKKSFKNVDAVICSWENNAAELAEGFQDNGASILWVEDITTEYHAQCEGLKCYEGN